MKLAVGSDEKTKLTDWSVRFLKEKGHDVQLFGALNKPKELWSQVAWEVAEAVKSGKADQGILFCWTGTGVALVANKVPGIRAVTITDVKTAEGARKWNHANILAMSCFLPQRRAKAVLDIWFSTSYSREPDVLTGIEKLKDIEQKYSR